jgi:integrase
MTRRSTGGVVPPKGERRSWAIRFRAHGKRHMVTLGRSEEGWNRQRAEAELRHVLADVERGNWKPYEPAPPPEAPSELTFGEFARDWLDGAVPALRRRTQEEYGWRLEGHLFPFFAEHRLSEITIQEVDRYRLMKVRDMKVREEARKVQLRKPVGKRGHAIRPFSQGSINRTINLLAQILDQAIEYGYIDRNPARGRKRLLKVPTPLRSYLQPDQVSALLLAARELDKSRRKDDNRRRLPTLAVLTLAGLRIGEVLNLRWRDIDLASRTLRVRQSKTDAGVREVDLSPALKEILSEHKARTPYGQPNDYVFTTRKGGRDCANNVRHRFLPDAVGLANQELRKAGRSEIEKITPHSLRRTFISLLLAAGADVPYVMAQAGHSDPKMTLGLYAKVISTKKDFGAALDGVANTSVWAQSGTENENEPLHLPASSK